MRAKRSWVAAAVGLVGLGIPTSASAAVTIGEDTSTPGDATFFGCSGFPTSSCTLAQTTHPARSYTAPFDGVIVRWRIRGDSEAVQFALRALHSNGDGTFTGAGTTEARTVSPGVENVFDSALPISEGELIGVNVPGADGLPHVDRRSVPGASFSVWSPTPLQDGETRAPSSSSFVNALIYNAELEPDCDSDGLGDESQDPSPACPRTLTLAANKPKVKKGRRVTLSGQLNEVVRQGPCESSQTVELQRKKPSQATFTMVDQLQTDAAGAFSAKEKVKKTFEYRAQVLETATCAGQTSNTEKVKVKKPK
jgi:hypothetical protein